MGVRHICWVCLTPGNPLFRTLSTYMYMKWFMFDKCATGTYAQPVDVYMCLSRSHLNELFALCFFRKKTFMYQIQSISTVLQLEHDRDEWFIHKPCLGHSCFSPGNCHCWYLGNCVTDQYMQAC